MHIVHSSFWLCNSHLEHIKTRSSVVRATCAPKKMCKFILRLLCDYSAISLRFLKMHLNSDHELDNLQLVKLRLESKLQGATKCTDCIVNFIFE